MFRIIPHRAFIEPKASIADLDARGEAAVATLRVEGLLCSACAANVRGRLEGLDGVRSAQVDLERGEARVTYDPFRATPQALVAAVEGAVVLRRVRRLLAALAHFTAGRASARRRHLPLPASRRGAGQAGAEACPADTRRV